MLFEKSGMEPKTINQIWSLGLKIDITGQPILGEYQMSQINVAAEIANIA